jgi:hypothetical protein
MHRKNTKAKPSAVAITESINVRVVMVARRGSWANARILTNPTGLIGIIALADKSSGFKPANRQGV